MRNCNWVEGLLRIANISLTDWQRKSSVVVLEIVLLSIDISSTRSGRHIYLYTSIMLQQWPYVPSVGFVRCPRLSVISFFIDNHFCSWRCQWTYFKLYVLKRAAWDDSCGFIWEFRKWFSIIIAWGISQSHSLAWNSGSVVHKPPIKWVLNVWITLSAMFWQCIWGGTNWYLNFLLSRACFKWLDTSLSIIRIFGGAPALVRISSIFCIAFVLFAADCVWIGSARKALLL